MNLPAASRRKLRSAALVSLAVIILSLMLHAGGVLQRAEWISYDWRSQHANQLQGINDEIVLMMIDEASLKALNEVAGRWPWPRSLFADLIDFINLGGPQAIVFDVMFLENQTAGEGKGLSRHDRRLIEALQQAGNVYLAAQIYHDNQGSAGNDSGLSAALAERYGLADPGKGGDDPLLRHYFPFPALLSASAGIGVVNVQADSDGVYRRISPMHSYRGYRFPGLSISALFREHVHLDGTAILIDQQRLPLDQQGRYLINFRNNFHTYSISGALASQQHLLNGDLEKMLIDPSEFAGKTVIVGASAAGVEDLKNTPLSRQLPGVYIHASALANILQNNHLRESSVVLTIVLTILFALVTVVFTLFIRRPVLQIGLPLILVGGYLQLTQLLFNAEHVINVTTPIVAVVLAWLGSSLLLAITEGKDKRKVRNMLSQYVSPAVLSQVVNHFEDHLHAEVGSKERLTMLFSDIRGFTSLSENLSAEKVVEALNYYFSQMNDTIFSHQGTIDKFIGDAIMAFWGAPIRIDNHADLAVQSALEMIERMPAINQWCAQQNLPPLKIGIGLHTGDVVLGNIGSDKKLDYTIIGDNVNLASRMEGLTKSYGSPILISETTFDSLQQSIPCRVVDLVKVKGKKVPIRILQPVTDAILAETVEQKAPAHGLTIAQIVQQTNQAFDHYRQQQWQQAIALYEGLPADALRELFLQRCRQYAQSPPPPDWDGAYTMTSK